MKRSRKSPDRERSGLGYWWRWRELNPRPKAIDAQYYMLSSPFGLVFRQYDEQNAPVDQPA